MNHGKWQFVFKHKMVEMQNMPSWAPEGYVDKSKTINEGIKKEKVDTTNWNKK